VAVWITSNAPARPHPRAIQSVTTPQRVTDRDARPGLVRAQSARIEDCCFPASRLYSATSSMAVRALHIIMRLVDAGITANQRASASLGRPFRDLCRLMLSPPDTGGISDP
jgi:hypothetical protein